MTIKPPTFTLVDPSSGLYYSHMAYEEGSYKPFFTDNVKSAAVFFINAAMDIIKLFPYLKLTKRSND